TSGDLYMMDINSISNVTNRRNKRLFDLSAAILLLSTYPINMWLVKKKARYLSNLVKIIFGSRSFVGYSNIESGDVVRLPKIRKGIIGTLLSLKNPKAEPELATKLNLIYAKDYKISSDINLVVKRFSLLGQQS